MPRPGAGLDKAKLNRLIEKAGDLRAQAASIKEELGPIDAAIERMLTQAKLDEVEPARFVASYIRPKRREVDKAKVAAMLSFADFAELAEIPVKAAMAHFTEEERKDLILERSGSPYLLIKAKGAEIGEAS